MSRPEALRSFPRKAHTWKVRPLKPQYTHRNPSLLKISSALTIESSLTVSQRPARTLSEIPERVRSIRSNGP